MKKAYICVISFFSILSVFTILYFISFKTSVTNQDAKAKASYVSSKTNSKIKITSDMKFILQTYNTEGKKLSEKVLDMPKDYIGKNFDELNEYLEYTNSHMTKEVKNQGFVSTELITFTNKIVIIKNTVNTSKSLYKYYVTSEKGYIIVYEKDRTTIFDETDIPISSLSHDEQQELNSGVVVKNQEELYSMLEGYSS